MRVRSLIGRMFLSLAGVCAGACAQDYGILDVDSALNSDQRLEVFAATDDGIFHRWENSPGGEWSLWTQNVARPFESVRTIRVAGRLFVFGLSDGALVVRAQAGPNAGFLEQSFRAGTQLQELAVTPTADGYLQVVAIGGDGNLWMMNSMVGEPRLTQDDWSNWTSVPANFLRGLTVALDGDLRMTVAGVTAAGKVKIYQQLRPNSNSAWREWPEMSSAPGIRSLKFVLGAKASLSLLGLDERGVVVGKTLARVGTSPLRAIETAKTRIRTAPVDPRTVLVRPRVSPGSVLVLPPLPLGSWTVGWSDVLRYPANVASGFTPAVDFDVARNPAGLAEIVAVANQNQVVHKVQSSSGGWTEPVNTLAGMFGAPPELYDKVHLQITPAGVERVFVIDRRLRRLFLSIRSSGATWKDQDWIALGKAPDGSPPDLTFVIKQCLDAELRQTIISAVKANLKEAVSNTPLRDLVGNINTFAQCSGSGFEQVALWLNHEPHASAFVGESAMPDDAIFQLRMAGHTLTNVIAGEVRKQVEKNQDISIKNFAVELNSPNTIDVPVDATWKGLPFTAKATATFNVFGGRPVCKAELTASAVNSYAGLNMIIPAIFIPIEVSEVDALLATEVAKVAAQIQVVCAITGAMTADIFLPKRTNEPLMKFVLPYLSITVSPSAGLVATGALPFQQAAAPALRDFLTLPWDRTQVVKTNAIKMYFQTRVLDMKPPVKLTWMPTISSFKLPNAINYPDTCCAFFTYGVGPQAIPMVYDLGVMKLRATDGAGQCLEASIPVRVVTRDPNDPDKLPENQLPPAPEPIASAACQ